MEYQRATSWVADTATVWLATMVLFASAALRMRESMLLVMTVPFGFRGFTAPEYAFTDKLDVTNVAAFVRTLVILTTSMELPPPSCSSHMGSPATASCMVVGRRLPPFVSFR